ncbi:MAG TPA: CDP-alcohol phosphatidyltransferase family protein [Nitrososphaerales archaeon]|nr:CDP-alcohol phosphatidyltransferase family protein [Nitrososphaerales archaeon]
MLDRLRTRLERHLTSLGMRFSKLGLSPTAWTMVGFAVSILAAYSYSASSYRGEFAGGILVLISGFFDIVDGAVAKVTGRTSMRGAFVDSTLDRVAEVIIFTGILVGHYGSALSIILALSTSLLVSYTRAKGDALGISLSGVGIGERSERLIIIAVSSIIGLLGWGVILVLVVALFTFVERIYSALKALP